MPCRVVLILVVTRDLIQSVGIHVIVQVQYVHKEVVQYIYMPMYLWVKCCIHVDSCSPSGFKGVSKISNELKMMVKCDVMNSKLTQIGVKKML